MEFNPSSSYMLVANPGSGKTHQLSEAICDYMEKGVKPEDMLCITFTERAADEMEKRIFEKMRERNISAAIPEVHTFHSYAFSVLSQHDSGMRVISDNLARYAVLQSILRTNALNYPKETILNDEFGSIPTVGKFVNAIRYLKSYGISPDDINPIAVMDKLGDVIGKNYAAKWEKYEEKLNEAEHLLSFFVEAFRDYEKAKSGSTIDYEDMLIHYLALSETRKYKYVFVDELQDINDMEARIVSKSGDKLFLVGDVKQAIFGFQGGNIRNFRNFMTRERVPSEKLVTNYRSRRNIVQYAREFFLKNVPDPLEYAELPDYEAKDEEDGALGRVITRKAERSILDLLKYMEEHSPGYRGEKTAIIVRNNNQAERITHALDLREIDYESTSSSRFSYAARRDIVTFLRGFVEKDTTTLRECIFSPFSGFTLREAFEISRVIQYKEYDVATKVLELHEFMGKIAEYGKDHTGIERLFNEVIIPKSVAMGQKYYNTAKGMFQSTMEYFDEIDGDLDSYIDFLQLASEGQRELSGKSNLVVTTVHKAKGLEFDNVIYWPVQNTSNRLSTLDSVVNSILMTRGMTSEENEFSLESLRIDFVAVTRAKKSLYLVLDPKSAQRFEVDAPQLADIDLAGEDVKENFQSRHVMAYSLFVDGRVDDALENLRNEGNWLVETIRKYFDSPLNISHSLIDRMDYPTEFLKQYILRVPSRSQAMQTGTRIHAIIESYIRSGCKVMPQDMEGDEKKAFDNFLAVHRSITESHNVVGIEAEAPMNGDTEGVFGISAPWLKMKGFIDAIYTYEKDGEKHYIVIDFKTSRKIEEAVRLRKNSDSVDTNYRRQISLYKRMLSVQRGIRPENIETMVVYLYLRPAVNTGVIDHYVDEVTYYDQHFEFEKRKFQKYLEYHEDPQKFIDDVINDRARRDDILSTVLYEELKSAS